MVTIAVNDVNVYYVKLLAVMAAFLCRNVLRTVSYRFIRRGFASRLRTSRSAISLARHYSVGTRSFQLATGIAACATGLGVVYCQDSNSSSCK